MFFNDRRQAKSTARALKKASGPSLASPKQRWESEHNDIERMNVMAEAKWGVSSNNPTRKARYAAATKWYEAKQRGPQRAPSPTIAAKQNYRKGK